MKRPYGSKSLARPKLCPTCENIFLPKRTDQKYCSPYCRGTAGQIRSGKRKTNKKPMPYSKRNNLDYAYTPDSRITGKLTGGVRINIDDWAPKR